MAVSATLSGDEDSLDSDSRSSDERSETSVTPAVPSGLFEKRISQVPLSQDFVAQHTQPQSNCSIDNPPIRIKLEPGLSNEIPHKPEIYQLEPPLKRARKEFAQSTGSSELSASELSQVVRFVSLCLISPSEIVRHKNLLRFLRNKVRSQ